MGTNGFFSVVCLMGVWLVLVSAVCAGEVSRERVSLEILEPPERVGVVRDFPVALGLVFPAGELTSVPGGRVVDDRGRAVPFEAEATGWWSADKASVKWLLVRFLASTDRRYFFERGGAAQAPEGEALAVEDAPGVRVSTGPLEVRLSGGHNRLFEEVRLNGRPVLAAEPAHHLVMDDGENQTDCALREWRVSLEQATPARAVVRASGYFCGADGERVARLDLRYQFFRGASFVRVYHTLTWMVKDPGVGARAFFLRLKPDGAHRVRVGLSGFGPESLDLPADGDSRVVAFQDGPERFRVFSGDEVVKTGAPLGGWAALESADGAGVAVCLRDAWQMFPTAFSAVEGGLEVGFWPGEAPRMGFEYRDLMPDDFFFDAAEWNRYGWVRDKGHFVHEYTENPYFLHTAEGAARTHELTLFFYDSSSRRTIQELNSLTQHPLVIRQDPASAMRVPFMGFEIGPVDAGRYPDIERAVEQVGRLTVGRWASVHDYGMWRFGMLRWSDPNGSLYRWFDGVQYDLQLIPWLLYMRGGGRAFFEAGEATARFAMDVGTNHYNTRGVPAGYQASAAGMPFPWAPRHLHKAMKVHFLAYYYHLTGYERAREVMMEVIEGTVQAAREDPHKGGRYARGRGRELYNMNVFWANACEETWSAEVKAFAREWADLSMKREFNGESRVFRAPEIYLYPGLVLQHRLWEDDELARVMLENLAEMGYPDLADGGVYDVEKAVGCGWAYAQTGDLGFVRIGWDVARKLADLVPDHDWGSAEAPRYAYRGHQFYRHLLLPILVGTSLAARHGLGADAPFVRRDAYVSLEAGSEARATGWAYLRPNRDGDLRVRVSFVGRWREAVPPVEVTALDAEGNVLARETVSGTAPPVVDRFVSPKGAFLWGELVLPGVRKGRTYRLRMEGDSRGQNVLMGLVLADARVVYAVPEGREVDFYQQAGQYYGGVRVYGRMARARLRVENLNRVPYTIRDAETGATIFRASMSDPETMVHDVGEGRSVVFVLPGRVDLVRFEGLVPYVSATPEGWFNPESEGP